jgi:adenylate kinase
VLMGPPGAGKGTQGALLASRFDIPRYSTGDILRAARRDGSELGRKAQGYMDAGELVPDDVILGLVRNVLMSAEAAGGYLLDGFPRTVAQARSLGNLLEEADRELDAVVNLRVDDEEIVKRLSSRRVCEECGAILRPEAGTDSCTGCGGRLLTRPDDRPETVQRRLEVYREQTEPVLAWYRESGTTMLDVPGTGDIEQVQERIVACLAL